MPDTFAAPLTFNVDGVITDSNNLPLEAAAVTFRIEIKDTAEACLLYREDFTVNMTASNGYFSIAVGKQANAVSGGSTLDKVFANNGTAISGQSCTYTPSAPTETRKVIVSFNDGVVAQVFSSQEIQAVPYALESVQSSKVANYDANHILRIDPAIASPVNSDLDAIKLAELFRLVNNPGAAYLSSLPTLGGDVSGTLVGMTVDKIKGFAVATPAGAADDGKVLTFNSVSGWTLQTGSIPTNSSYSTKGLLQFDTDAATSGMIYSSAGVAKVNVGLGAGQILRLSTAGQLPALDGSLLTNLNIGSGSISSSKILDGTIVDADISNSAGIAWSKITAPTTLAGYGVTDAVRNNGLAPGISSNLIASIPATGTVGELFVAHDSGAIYRWNGSAWVVVSSKADASKLPLAGGTMLGAINMGGQNITSAGNITMSANKYLTLSANSTDGTSAGQMWYDAGIIKYYDGSTTKSLGVAGAGVTNLNGLTAASQSFANGTAGVAPVFVSGTNTHTLNIPMANTATVTAGLISKAEYDTFSAKMSNSLNSAQMWVGNSGNTATAVTMSGDTTIDNLGAVAIGANKVTTAKINDGAITAAKLSSGAAITATSGVIIAGTTGNIANLVCATNGHVLTWTVTGWTCAYPQASLPSLVDGKIWIGNSSNGAAALTLSGDVSLSNAGVTTLSASGVTAGSYSKVVVDSKGRVTVGQSMLAGDITTALGYSPLNRAGDTMSGNLLMGANDITGAGNIIMGANKYFTLSANTTSGSSAGQMWYDTGTIKYYDGSTVKSLGVAGAGITSLNGLTSGSQNFATGTTGTDFNISSASSTHTLNLPTASATNRGALSSADWSTFNAKMSNALTSAQLWVGNSGNAATAVTMSGDATLSNAGVVTIVKSTTGTANQIVALNGSSVATMSGLALVNSGTVTLSAGGASATYGITLPVAQGGSGNTLINNGSGVLTWGTPAGTDATKLPLAGGTMAGAIAMSANDITGAGNITMGPNKYFTLSTNTTNGSSAGQMWYDTGTIKYYDGSTVKSLGVAGAGITNLNGLTSGTQTFANGTSGTAPAFVSATNTHTLNIPMANTATVIAGLISKTEYDTFNGKMSNALSSTQIWVGNSTNGAQARTVAGDATIDNAGSLTLATSGVTAGSYSKVTVDAKGRVTSGANLAAADLPALNAGFIWVGNASSGATAVTLSGDVSLSNAGVTTLSASGVTAGSYSKVVVDSKGRVTVGQSMLAADITTALGYSPLNRAGDTMSGNLLMGANDITGAGNIIMGANKYFTLSANTTSGSSAGQMWYDTGTIKYYDGSTVRSLGIAGAGITSLNGLTSGTQNFATGTTGTDFNISSATSTHTLNLPTASATNRGALSSADWSTFNAKMGNALTSAQMWVGNSGNAATAVTMSGDATLSNAGALTLATSGVTAGSYSKVTVDAKGRVTSGATLAAIDLPALAAGKIWVGNSGNGATAVTLSGDVSAVSNAGAVTVLKSATGTASQIVALNGSSIATMSGLALTNTGTVTLSAQTASSTYGLKFPAAPPAVGQVMQSDASGNLSWMSPFTSATGWENGGNNFTANASIGTIGPYSVDLMTNGVSRLTIDNAGNIGVGNTSPGSLFDVAGNRGTGLANFANSNVSSGSAATFFGGNGSRLVKLASWDYAAVFMGGNVGIGTTTPATALQVAGVITPSVNNTYTLGSATFRFSEVYATNGIINTSDRREKKDIFDADLGLDFINRLRPVSYRWNTGIDSDVHYGLIAQEAEQTLLTFRPQEKTSIVTYDESADKYGVRYSELISPLIKAVQQLYQRVFNVESKQDSVNAKIAQLETENALITQKIKDLEKENADLKTRMDRIENLLNSK